jgi:hypothetical protein
MNRMAIFESKRATQISQILEECPTEVKYITISTITKLKD